MACFAPDDRSNERPALKGPQAFTRTETDLPILGLPIGEPLPTSAMRHPSTVTAKRPKATR